MPNSRASGEGAAEPAETERVAPAAGALDVGVGGVALAGSDWVAGGALAVVGEAVDGDVAAARLDEEGAASGRMRREAGSMRAG